MKINIPYTKIAYLVAAISLPALLGTSALNASSAAAAEEDNLTLIGAKFAVYKRDRGESATANPLGETFISGVLKKGPTNSMMTLMSNSVAPNAEGDFIGYPVGTKECDGASCFAISNEVQSMYANDLINLSRQFPANVSLRNAVSLINGVGRPPLNIYIRSGKDANAFYTTFNDGRKEVRELRFFNFSPRDYNPKAADVTIFTEQSPEVVAHETGHALLDLLKPKYFETSAPQVGAFHESFGDLTALFHTTSQGDLADAVILATKGNFHKRSFFNTMAEEFGKSLGLEGGLRDADRDIRPAQAGDEVHDLSEVFTGAIYDIWSSAFITYYNAGYGVHPTDALRNVSTYLRQLVLQTIVENENPEPTFGNLAYDMARLADHRPVAAFGELANVKWSELIKREFTQRGVVLTPAVHEKNTALDQIGHAVKICQTRDVAGCAAAAALLRVAEAAASATTALMVAESTVAESITQPVIPAVI